MYPDIQKFEYGCQEDVLALRMTELLKMDIYYMLLSSESNDDWNNTNILGLNLRLVFYFFE